MNIEKLNIRELAIDRRVQRELDGTWVAKIAKNLDLDQLGIITVSRREDGSTIILDGQHRVEALRYTGHTEYVVDCRVLDELTIEEEARTFRILNNTRNPSLVSRFLARVIEGEETATDINKILGKFGWQPSHSKVDGSFSAISTLEVVYRGSREAAWSTIETVTQAWGNSLAAVHGQIIFGLGAVYQRHGDEVLISRMVSHLSPITPAELLIRAKALASARGRRVGSAVSELAIAEYNRQRGTKLPDWNSPRQTRKSRLGATEHIRALTKVANEADASPVAAPITVAAPMFVDAVDLLRATPDASPGVWR